MGRVSGQGVFVSENRFQGFLRGAASQVLGSLLISGLEDPQQSFCGNWPQASYFLFTPLPEVHITVCPIIFGYLGWQLDCK